MADTLEQLDEKYVESEKISLMSTRKLQEMNSTLQVGAERSIKLNFGTVEAPMITSAVVLYLLSSNHVSLWKQETSL